MKKKLNLLKLKENELRDVKAGHSQVCGSHGNAGVENAGGACPCKPCCTCACRDWNAMMELPAEL